MERLRRRRDLIDKRVCRSRSYEEQVWDHPPTLFVLVGMALVIGGGLGAIRGEPELPLTAIAS